MRAQFGWAVRCVSDERARDRFPLAREPVDVQFDVLLIDSSPTRLDLFSNPGVVLQPSTYDNTLPLSFVFSRFVDYAGGRQRRSFFS